MPHVYMKVKITWGNYGQNCYSPSHHSDKLSLTQALVSLPLLIYYGGIILVLFFATINIKLCTYNIIFKQSYIPAVDRYDVTADITN